MLVHGFGAEAGGVGKKVASTIECGEVPGTAGLLRFGETTDEVLGSLAHDFGKRPILLLGDGSEPLVEQIREMNLDATHDALSTPQVICDQAAVWRETKDIAECLYQLAEKSRLGAL